MADYVSNAQPIQFWSINDQTYNERTSIGFVRAKPYIHKCQLSDPQKLQVTDDTDNDDYALKIVDRDGNLLRTSILSPLPALSTWSNLGATGINWSSSPTKFHSGSGGFATSKYWGTPFVFITGIAYHFTWDITVNPGANINYIKIVSLDAGDNLVEMLYENLGFTESILDLVLIPTINAIKIAVVAQTADGLTNEDVTINTLQLHTNYGEVEPIPFIKTTVSSADAWQWQSTALVQWQSGQFVDLLDGAPVFSNDLEFIFSNLSIDEGYFQFIIQRNNLDAYKSDYLSFKSSIVSDTYNGSKLLSYKQSTNYASIQYPNTGNYFTLRLPCKFFTERTQTVQTSINLTSKSIDTSEFIKFQRWFQIPVMPDYMLKKVELILGHSVKGSLLIDSIEWTKQESMNRSGAGGDIKYPEQMADIWLTEKNNGVRNII